MVIFQLAMLIYQRVGSPMIFMYLSTWKHHERLTETPHTRRLNGLQGMAYIMPPRRGIGGQVVMLLRGNMGVSENSVPLNPMVLLIIIPIKWLFHWEY